MTDIIFIAFEFAPLNIGGVFRPLKFVKYLPDHGIRPTVYSLPASDYNKVYRQSNTDEHLVADLEGRDIRLQPVGIDPIWDMYSTKWKSFVNIYFNTYRGNEYKNWERYLLEKVISDAKNIPFKAVVVTAPPFGMIPLAEKIAQRLKLPLIIDMRDAWAFWNMNGYGTYFHYLATLRKEFRHFSAARTVIATSDQTITDWLKLHPALPPGKFVCIPNGYDTDAALINFAPYKILPAEKEFFDIVYVGSFYYSPGARATMLKPFYKKRGLNMLQYYPRRQDWLYRSPYFFFKTLQKAFELEPWLQKKIRVTFAGNKQPWMKDMIAAFGLSDHIKETGFISHEESLALQSNADALLITSAKVTGGKDCFIAGKTFEYITMSKPILAFVAEGAQKDILAQTGLSILFDPDNTDAAALTLVNLVKNGIEIKPNESFIRSFERRALTKQLASVINNAIGRTDL